MYRIHITHHAETDLEDIWIYSLTEWGEAQADNYHEELTTAIHQLASNPKFGRSIEAIRANYRAASIRRHVIYYRLGGEVIRIMRVLHERMEPRQHLG